MPDLPPLGKSVEQLERELGDLIKERATASEIRELRAELAALKAEIKAREDARAGSSADDGEEDPFDD